jgi:hypothetical protein
MHKYILPITLVFLYFLGVALLLGYYSEEEQPEEIVYQGPVRPTDDEAHFRKTGITRPLIPEDNR